MKGEGTPVGEGNPYRKTWFTPQELRTDALTAMAVNIGEDYADMAASIYSLMAASRYDVAGIG